MGAGVTLVMIGLLAGCMGSEPPAAQEFTLNACDLIETATVEALIGEIESQEEPMYKDSLPRGSGPTCKTYPVDISYSPLEMRVTRSSNKNILALLENAIGCDESVPLEVDGAVGYSCADVGTGGLPGASLKATWGDDPVYYTSIYFVIDRDGQSFAEIAVPMQDAVKDLMEKVDEDSFVPKLRSP